MQEDDAPTLAQALDDDDASVRWKAAAGLIALGRPGLESALHLLTNHEFPSPQLKASVRHVLLGLNVDAYESIVAPLLHAIEDHAPDEVIMVEAYKAIEALASTAP
ncbi:MAG: hypothetical protein PVH40_00775 [Gemmatimonadales bacterium]|jgi:hypothetical protein